MAGAGAGAGAGACAGPAAPHPGWPVDCRLLPPQLAWLRPLSSAVQGRALRLPHRRRSTMLGPTTAKRATHRRAWARCARWGGPTAHASGRLQGLAPPCTWLASSLARSLYPSPLHPLHPLLAKAAQRKRWCAVGCPIPTPKISHSPPPQTNYLGPYALTRELEETLQQSAPARVRGPQAPRRTHSGLVWMPGHARLWPPC